MPRIQDPDKSLPWKSSSEANKQVRSLFRSGQWNPISYSPKELWESDPIFFKSYSLGRFRDNIRKTATLVNQEGEKDSDFDSESTGE